MTLSTDTHQKILNEAFLLFGRHGYDGMSMKVVAEKAGITKAALYWHFESKDDLYLECVKKAACLVEDHTHAPLEDNELPPMLRLATMVAGVRALLTHPEIIGGIAGYWLTPSDGHIDRVWEVVRGFRKKSFELLEKCLVEGRQQGVFEFDIPVEKFARTVHYTIEANMIPLAFFADQLEVREHTALVMDSFAKAYSPNHLGFGKNLDDLQRLLDTCWTRHIAKCPRASYMTEAPQPG